MSSLTQYWPSKPWSSQLWTQFKQLRIEAWKSQDFILIPTNICTKWRKMGYGWQKTAKISYKTSHDMKQTSIPVFVWIDLSENEPLVSLRCYLPLPHLPRKQQQQNNHCTLSKNWKIYSRHSARDPSSEWSAQSATRSQTKIDLMHSPFKHLNWSRLHFPGFTVWHNRIKFTRSQKTLFAENHCRTLPTRG